MIKKSTLLLTLVALFCSFSINAADLYLVGGFTNWEFHPDMKFTEESPNIYKLTGNNIEVFGKFKIATNNWSTEYASPIGGSAPQLGEPYTLAGKGSNQDIDLGADTYTCTEITIEVTDPNKSATLTMVGEKKVEEITSVYVIGDNNSWNFMDTSAKLDETSTDGVYEGQVTMDSASGKAYGYWRIYEGLGQKGTWGTANGINTDVDPENPQENVTSATLKRGSEGCVTTNAGTYVFRFNINTGEFTATPLGSVESVATDGVSVVGKRGEIEVAGAADVKVYTLGGALISEGEANAKVPAGLYIVKADGKVKKVVVK